ncbi:phosphoenolpyruvate carboxylase kinase 1-like [Durio zibethinus]|uniref:Phosphoenolpyruvate carboxylase kinase 1-like n=1 Tax=Durio zibethinus TaxID=66656 RepID=A0A6P6AXT2_DURZI|nr:phosphoenolpyruvate carboxylase kinase 1-like [Durio zibethinus]
MEVKGVKLKVLGRGAYGVVHLVETTSPCSGLFAVKSAPLTKSFSLSKEWEIFKKFIGCPNIVQCFGGFTSFERDGGGYIHSDLKPENILVFPSQTGSDLNTLKIADFGLARQCGEKDIPQLWEYGFRGTADYMSPESVMGEISGALDIWSLGCIIVEMISGKMPWNYRQPERFEKQAFEWRITQNPRKHVKYWEGFLNKVFC